MENIALKMLKHHKGINVGEIAGYPEDIAKKMVKLGMGKYYNKNEVEVEEDKKPTPEAKIMMEVDILMDGKIEDIKKELDNKTSDGSYLYEHQYLVDALDYESLNKGRDGMMEYLMEEVEKRNE